MAIRQIYGVSSSMERDFLSMSILALDHADGLIKIKNEYFDLSLINEHEKHAEYCFLRSQNIINLFDDDDDDDMREYQLLGRIIRNIKKFVMTSQRLLEPDLYKNNRELWLSRN